jgi:glycosyltransferase involved in cell wall biosynthesis
LAKAKAFIFPSEEDFGIVPVEAQACGTPVIAYGRGGALETVIPWPGNQQQGHYPTGLFFEEQTAESLVDAVGQFERIAGELDAEKICQHAQMFSVAAFKTSFALAVNAALKTA